MPPRRRPWRGSLGPTLRDSSSLAASPSGVRAGARGRCRGRPPRDCCGRSARRARPGAPRSTIRPRRIISTSLHSRSTSPMLCEASRIAAPLAVAIALEIVPAPSRRCRDRGEAVGSSSSSSSGAVEQGLGERDPGLLPGGEARRSCASSARSMARSLGHLRDPRRRHRRCRRAWHRPSGSRARVSRCGRST